MRTIIIAFEGIDGAGKTVQMHRLKKALESRGMTVATRSFPVYTSYFGAQIGEYLAGETRVRADELDARSMALWFAMDRFVDFKNYVEGAADVLLINRYVLSNAVYQSIRDRDREDLYDWVMELEHGQLGLPEPDIYLVLDVAPPSAGRNVEKKGSRDYVGAGKDVYEQAEGIQMRARQKYLDYAATVPNIALIPCMNQGVLMSELEVARCIEETLFERVVL